LNLRRQSRGIYSPLPLAARATRQGRTSSAAIMDSERVAHRTASDYASKARELGLLPETKPGVVTIETPKRKKGK